MTNKYIKSSSSSSSIKEGKFQNSSLELVEKFSSEENKKLASAYFLYI